MSAMIRQMRVKHYIKNLLVFLPLFFGGGALEPARLGRVGLGFLAFCAVSSAVYVINDLRDLGRDREHPVKRERPLASGAIGRGAALGLIAACLAAAAALSALLGDLRAAGCLALYLALNLGYSMGLKDVPILDVVILSAGFVIRVFYGSALTGFAVSKWLFLVVTAGSLYMSLGKRRNELLRQGEDREVLRRYSVPFLDKNMYVCAGLAIVFYALWAIEMPDPRMIWTVPLVIVILMCYSLDIEGASDGDPVEVILRDRRLLALAAAYAVCAFLMLYVL